LAAQEALGKVLMKLMKMAQKKLDGTGLRTQLAMHPITKEPQLKILFQKPLPSMANPHLVDSHLSLSPDSDFSTETITKTIEDLKNLAD
jgi:hypothetical protein